jgi:hypothetical protein
MEPVPDYEALTMEEYLVIADVHLGLEYEMFQKGLRIGSVTGKVKRKLMRILEMTGKKRLIVLGDLKHNLPIPSFSEKEETPFFLDLPVEITIVKGNHDADIEALTGLPVLKEIVIDDVYLTHGHMTIPEERLKKDIVVGHSHPAIELKDRMGKRYVEKCWVQGKIRGKNNRVIFMPSFSPLLVGTPFNTSGNIPGTLFSQNLIDVGECDVHLIDGTYLGKVADVKVED